MPRKVKPFPQILFTQALSTGRLIKPRYIVSDLPDENGEYPVTMVPQDDRPVRELPSGDELITRAKSKKIAAQMNMLKALGIVEDDRPKPIPKPVAPAIPGMRQVGKLGAARALYIPADPIRRGR